MTIYILLFKIVIFTSSGTMGHGYHMGNFVSASLCDGHHLFTF